LLIGDGRWRGQGVFVEIFVPIANELMNIGVSKIYLSVEAANVNAYRAYKKSGFK
jgi:hypothetical protein